MTMRLLGQMFLRACRGENSRVPSRDAQCFNDFGELKVGKREQFFDGIP
jgi:hypothetical protein